MRIKTGPTQSPVSRPVQTGQESDLPQHFDALTSLSVKPKEPPYDSLKETVHKYFLLTISTKVGHLHSYGFSLATGSSLSLFSAKHFFIFRSGTSINASLWRAEGEPEARLYYAPML